MQLEIKFAELHAPLFLAGTNLQMKLDPTKRVGLKLIYDRGEKELIVQWNGHEAIVPISNVASMTAKTVELIKPVPTAPHPELARGKITAQVSTPQSHVFAGAGHGDTGQKKKADVVI